MSNDIFQVYQEFGRNIFGLSRGNVLRPLQNLSAWSTATANTRSGQALRVVSDLPLYLLNPIEIGAGARGIIAPFGNSINNLAISSASPTLQLLSNLIHDTFSPNDRGN